MSRKFLTFLGTSPYKPTVYTLSPDKPGVETSFVQTAVNQFWGPFDESYIFVTEDAKKRNWELLCQTMQQQTGTAFLTLKDIPDGKNETEIWDIFSILRSCIAANDVVVFDVTHSFRSIPILTLACIQYMRSLESVQLERIVYGAWEARTPYKNTYESDDPPPKAPIFDLTPFVELMDWSHAISEFDKYGQIGPLRDLVKKDGNTFLMTNKLRQNLSTVVDHMTNLQKDILTCRGRSISEGKRLEAILPSIKKLKHNVKDLPPAFRPLLEKLESKLIKLSGPPDITVADEVRRGFGAVDWCLSHGLIQQAYTIFQESLITHFCQLEGLNFHEKASRTLAAQAAKTFNIDQIEWDPPAKDNPETIRNIHEKVGKEVLALFDSLSGNRNDINHAKTTSTNTPESLKKKIDTVFGEIVSQFSIYPKDSSQ
jgi:CRISPR-associated Csx2 family protein